MGAFKSFLLLFLVFSAASSSAQYVKYNVKVVLDTLQSVKGTLQKVSAEGIAIEDFSGNYHIFKAKNIVKIKVKKKGLSFIESFAGGTGLGLAAGLSAFKDTHSAPEAIAGTALLTGVGLAVGSVTGLVAEAINTKLILYINQDPEKYKREYLKLEPYSKAYFFDQP
jgi:hypothetical protein